MGISMSCRPGLQALIKVLLYDGLDSYVAPGIGFLFVLSVSHIIVFAAKPALQMLAAIPDAS